jgi:hypothetical protein
MSRIDQFESQFLAAAKDRFRFRTPPVERVVVFTDLERGDSEAYGADVREFLGTLHRDPEPEWKVVPGSECYTIGDILAIVDSYEPQLVCTYRNLHSGAWRWPHSLSDHLEVLTQSTIVPVLLLPRPAPHGSWSPSGMPRSVMALTDHLSGDDLLVNWAVSLVQEGGKLILSHVEDEQTFERYMGVLNRVPEIDSSVARDVMLQQLLREPADYIDSCVEALSEEAVAVSVDSEVLLGHRLATYRELVERHEVDLLVLNTKDEDQLAMHGMSYPLAVELRDVPMLMT